ncbi:hypothetical protein CRYUN_Cryun12cG0069000 [Craigia yunnanensis]
MMASESMTSPPIPSTSLPSLLSPLTWPLFSESTTPTNLLSRFDARSMYLMLLLLISSMQCYYCWVDVNFTPFPIGPELLFIDSIRLIPFIDLGLPMLLT